MLCCVNYAFIHIKKNNTQLTKTLDTGRRTFGRHDLWLAHYWDYRTLHIFGLKIVSWQIWLYNNNFLLRLVVIVAIIHWRSSSRDVIVHQRHVLLSRFALCIAYSSTSRRLVSSLMQSVKSEEIRSGRLQTTVACKASTEQLNNWKIQQLSWLVLHVTTVIRTSVFYPHIRT